ncbi:hydroxyacid dehydrogenase [bacterium]|nr:hydroxyacid dehydrogenase [bacterium]
MSLEKWTVVAPDGLDVEAIDLLKSHDWVKLDQCEGCSSDEKYQRILKADFLIVRSATKVTQAMLSEASSLKGVIRAGVGVDNIDLKAAESAGVWAWNAPNGNFQSAAELAIALIFAVARNIGPAYVAGTQQKWAKKELSSSGRQIFEAKLGLFGAGNIGKRVAKMASGLGMQVSVCDPFYKPDDLHSYPSISFEQLLSESDFISIHSPLLDSTKNVFSKEAFKKMKKDSFLVNAARGGIIDEPALLEALEQGEIAGAALDVFASEPFEGDFYKKLLSSPKLITTPHIGASTREAQRLVGLECVFIIEQVRASLAENDLRKWPKSLNSPQNPRIS